MNIIMVDDSPKAIGLGLPITVRYLRIPVDTGISVSIINLSYINLHPIIF